MRVVAGEEMAGEVLVVVDEDKGSIWSVVEICGRVGTEVVVVVTSIRSVLVEEGGEDIISEGVEGIRVPEGVITAFVDVLP